MSKSRSRNSDGGNAADAACAPALARALDGFIADLKTDRASGSTLDAYRRDLERYLSLATTHGVDQVTQLSPEHVKHLLDALQLAQLRSATIARNLSSVRRFHDHLMQTGASSSDPTRDVSQPRVGRRDPEPLTTQQARRLVTAVTGDDPRSLRDRAMLETFYAAGLRVTELTSLTCADVLAAQRLLRVRGRGTRERMVPLVGAAVQSLERYLESGHKQLAGESDILFVNSTGRALSRMGVWKIVRAAADKAGIERVVSPQTLRHTFAAHLLDGGALLQDVQHLLGHADIASTQIYARTQAADLTDLYNTYHPRA